MFFSPRSLSLALVLASAAFAQRAQSPVNFTLENVTGHSGDHIEFHYESNATVNMVNTVGTEYKLGNRGNNSKVIAEEWGTLKVNVPGNGSYVVVNGVRYNLLQFHFHNPAEHMVSESRMPMEVHFVHLREDGCNGAARPVLVIGAFITPGEATEQLKKVFVDTKGSWPSTTSDAAITINNVNLRHILPDDSHSWHYDGSLTAPSTTCSSTPIQKQLPTDVFPEIVNWYVLEDTIHLPWETMDAFREMFKEGNSRPIQPVYGRTIYRDADAH